MKYKIFVDGQEGTTGLEIYQHLGSRKELEVLRINPDLRKDPGERKRMINQANIVFLCLPDDAAKESVSLVENDHTCLIDASTAHRTDPNWVYGLPELNKSQRQRIRQSRRITVPGCHATGFVAAMAPLVASGVVPPDYPASCFSITGYSGGGKKLIARYEVDLKGTDTVEAHRMYALGLRHKHLPEMACHTGLRFPPVFNPILANIYKGMVVSIPLQTALLPGSPSAHDIHKLLVERYLGECFIKVMPFGGEGALDEGYLQPMGCNNTNRLELYVFGHQSQAVVSARFDNLGKGASGAAVQCMNIRLGLDETTGLKA